MHSLYSVLGVPHNSNQREIEKAYKKLALRYHPDRYNKDDSVFKSIVAAYEVLGDFEQRQDYDLKNGFLQRINPMESFWYGESNAVPNGKPGPQKYPGRSRERSQQQKRAEPQHYFDFGEIPIHMQFKEQPVAPEAPATRREPHRKSSVRRHRENAETDGAPNRQAKENPRARVRVHVSEGGWAKDWQQHLASEFDGRTERSNERPSERTNEHASDPMFACDVHSGASSGPTDGPPGGPQAPAHNCDRSEQVRKDSHGRRRADVIALKNHYHSVIQKLGQSQQESDDAHAMDMARASTEVARLVAQLEVANREKRDLTKQYEEDLARLGASHTAQMQEAKRNFERELDEALQSQLEILIKSGLTKGVYQ